MSNVKPLPCPFCGGVATILKTSGDERDGYADKVICACNKCGCSITVSGDTSKGGYADNRGVEARAILSWNKRTTPASPQAAQPVAIDDNVEFEKWWMSTPILRKQKIQIAQEAWFARAKLRSHADAGELHPLLVQWLAMFEGGIASNPLSALRERTRKALSTTAKTEADQEVK